ncbi:MAG TPA: LytTR family DNA-binding domain-containing protein [Mucilaginibacter sp.]|nr:LytTR family DNA-binding domain-containing protein [Mucilaginibacter sp.]
MNRIRVIIIDDERLAREEVKHALKAYPDFEVVAEAGNADEAKKLIEAGNPDVLFLDIQMPGKSGFDLLESLDHVPQVVFTTAFDQYAVRAFDINALDYLVKPIRQERFAKAMERVREKLVNPSKGKEQLSHEQQVFIKDGDKCHFVKLKDVYLIESMDNYARLYFGEQVTYIKRSLNQLEEKLDASVFFRINRTQIINTLYIKQIEPMPTGRIRISLKTGETLDVSSRQSVLFKSWKRL